MENKPYLCSSYPENNLFTLSRLIPIEDLERLPVKVIAFFVNTPRFLLILPKRRKIFIPLFSYFKES